VIFTECMSHVFAVGAVWLCFKPTTFECLISYQIVSGFVRSSSFQTFLKLFPSSPIDPRLVVN
jgi:hypothetical protein